MSCSKSSVLFPSTCYIQKVLWISPFFHLAFPGFSHWRALWKCELSLWEDEMGMPWSFLPASGELATSDWLHPPAGFQAKAPRTRMVWEWTGRQVGSSGTWRSGQEGESSHPCRERPERRQDRFHASSVCLYPTEGWCVVSQSCAFDKLNVAYLHYMMKPNWLLENYAFDLKSWACSRNPLPSICCWQSMTSFLPLPKCSLRLCG